MADRTTVHWLAVHKDRDKKTASNFVCTMNKIKHKGNIDDGLEMASYNAEEGELNRDFFLVTNLPFISSNLAK